MRLKLIFSFLIPLIMIHNLQVAFGTPQLSLILEHMKYFPDVLLLTEDVNPAIKYLNDPSTGREVQSLAVSVLEKSFLDQDESNLDTFYVQSLHSVVINASNFTMFKASLKKICSFSSHHSGELLWTPHVFITFPTPLLDNANFENDIRDAYTSLCLENASILGINSEVYILISHAANFAPNTHISAFELYSIQNITIFREIKDRFGYFNQETFLRKVQRRRDFNCARLRVVVQERLSAVTVIKEEGGEIVLSDGYSVNYFMVMADFINIRPVAVMGIGLISPDGEFSLGGYGKQLINGDADLSINYAEMMPYRAKHLSFLHPHYVARILAFFKQPRPTSVRDIYIRSVKDDLRIATIVAWISIILSISTISCIQKYYFEKLSTETSDHDGSIQNVLLWGLAAFCQQGSHIQTSSTSMKIGVLISLLFSVICYTGFSASVVSQLSVPVIPIKSFRDILNSDMAIHRENITQATKVWMDHAIQQGTIKPMNPDKSVIESGEAIEIITTNQAVVISLADEFYLSAANVTDEFLCKTISKVVIDPIGLPSMSAMTVRKGSPYTEFLKYAQLHMREFGVHQRLHDNYLRRSTPKCQKMSHGEHLELGLNDTLTAFVFLLAFKIASICALVVEICLKRFCNVSLLV